VARAAEEGWGKVIKTNFIDLGVKVAGMLTEIDEVKSGCRRPFVYSGIGQILVHEASNGRSARFLVLPDDGDLKSDLQQALLRNGIRVIRFHMGGEVIDILP
jgi:hypothetical protein